MKETNMQFKTTLNCGGCVSKVQADLDQLVGVNQWDVAISHPDKILTVHSLQHTPQEIIQLIRSKGFTAEELTEK